MFTALWQLLDGWPRTWDMTLERLVEIEGPFATDAPQRLPHLLTTQFSAPEFTWLYRAWEDFMWKNRSSMACLYPWMRHWKRTQQAQEAHLGGHALLSRREAAERLHRSERTVHHMVEREQVQVLPSPVETAEGSRRRWQLIEADTLAKVQEEFDGELTLEQTATMCGVSKGGVRALVKARLLPALRGPAHGGASEWAFDKQATHQTLSRLIGNLPLCLKVYSADESCLTLSQTLRIVTPAGIALPLLLQAMQNGQVASVRVTEDVTLSGLRFERASLLTFLAEQRPAEPTNVLSNEEVRQRLHCSASTLDRWYKTRLLVPCDQSMVGLKRRWQYRSQDVATFAERFITAKEAAFLLGCNQLTVQNRARSGMLPAVSGPHIDGSHKLSV